VSQDDIDEQPTAVPPVHADIYSKVALIPEGRVATYGQIAKLTGRCGPRQVGTALARVPAGLDVPWQRVVNARGEISARAEGGPSARQRERLEREGVVFNGRGRIDLKCFGWTTQEMLWALEAHQFLGDEEP
jgi:methylated-DNA-protein-cysteine methyltransferase related protein